MARVRPKRNSWCSTRPPLHSRPSVCHGRYGAVCHVRFGGSRHPADSSSRSRSRTFLGFPRTSARSAFDKPESTNLAPVFLRPRLGIRLPWRLGLKGSWIPPFRLFDVKANVLSAAVSRAFDVGSGVRLTPRLSVLTGRVEGPITCNRDAANRGDQSLMTYYTFVCYGNDSRDLLRPKARLGRADRGAEPANGRWEPYASAGARGERTRFDIGVIREDGSRDLDKPILEVKTTRAYGTAGTSWIGFPRTRLAARAVLRAGERLHRACVRRGAPMVTPPVGAVTRAHVAAWLGVVAVALGCADFETPVDPTGGAPDTLVPTPSFSANVAPIFQKRCADRRVSLDRDAPGGAHVGPDAAYESIVGVPSTLQPSILRVVRSSRRNRGSSP